MNLKKIAFSIAIAAFAASPAAFADTTPAPAPSGNPTIDFYSLFFIFPFLTYNWDSADPIDVNSIDILFTSIEDPLAFDNPPPTGMQ